MNTVLQDIRFAVRMLAKSPGFTLVAVVTLALGIGANSVMFTMLKGVLFRPLPGVPASDQIRSVISISNGGLEWPLSFPDYRDIRDRNVVFSEVAASSQTPMNVRIGDGEAKRIWGEAVTGNWFQMLGTRTTMGRGLNADDERAGDASPVVVLSHGFWQREYGGRGDILGQVLVIGNRPFTVIGVTEPSFRGSVNGLALELFVPLVTYQQEVAYRKQLEDRGRHWLVAQGRLKPGMSFETAKVSLAVLGEQIQNEHKNQALRQTAALIPLWKTPFGSQRILLPVYSLLMVVAALVLLISCANVANLLLARTTGRQREIAVRRALGAGRARLLRQLLTESILLSLVGGAAGALAGLWFGEGFSRLEIPTPLPVVLDVQFDWLVFGFTFAVSLISGVVFGIAPAMQTSAGDVVTFLREGYTTGGAGKSRLRNVLVVAQISAACMLLIGAGLAERSFENSRSLNSGFHTERMALFSVDLKPNGYTATTGPVFYRRLLEQAVSQPGVESAAIASFLPLRVVGAPNRQVEVEGYVPQPDENMSLFFNLVSPGYFSTMQMSVVQGRDFDWRDDPSRADVAVVSEAFVRHYYAGSDPLGRRIRTGGRWREVVGVVQDIQYLTLTEKARPIVYLPLDQNFVEDLTVHVRTAQDPAAMFSAMQGLMKELDPNLPIYRTRTMREHVRFSRGGYYIASNLMGTAGLISLLLATMGIYGVVAYAVGQRTREIGIRMALGASRNEIARMVLGQGFVLATFGVLLGITGALALTRLLGSVLLGVSAQDPVIFSQRALLLAAVALLATYLPARRAARIDPMVALRYE